MDSNRERQFKRDELSPGDGMDVEESERGSGMQVRQGRRFSMGQRFFGAANPPLPIAFTTATTTTTTVTLPTRGTAITITSSCIDYSAQASPVSVAVAEEQEYIILPAATDADGHGTETETDTDAETGTDTDDEEDDVSVAKSEVFVYPPDEDDDEEDITLMADGITSFDHPIRRDAYLQPLAQDLFFSPDGQFRLIPLCLSLLACRISHSTLPLCTHSLYFCAHSQSLGVMGTIWVHGYMLYFFGGGRGGGGEKEKQTMYIILLGPVVLLSLFAMCLFFIHIGANFVARIPPPLNFFFLSPAWINLC